jgi:hypothetical protein
MSSRKKITTLLGACFIVVIGLGVLVLNLLNDPSKGTIKPVEEVSTSNVGLDLAMRQLSGKYFKIVHLASYGSSSDTSSSNPRALEQRTLLKELYPGFERIVITILTMEPGGLAEESSYQLRLSKPDQYIKTNETLGSHDVTVFSSSDQSEVVVFLTNKSLVATMAVTSTHTSGELGSLARELTRSFEWL